MLLLYRRPGERFFIGSNIMITIRDICPKTHRVCLSVHAPKDIPINREEMADRETLAGIYDIIRNDEAKE